MPTPDHISFAMPPSDAPLLKLLLCRLFSCNTLDLSIKDLCKDVGIRRSQLWKCSIEQLGSTPSQVLDCLRAARMLYRLKANPYEKIYAISNALGFHNDSSMSRFCYRTFALRPSDVKAEYFLARSRFATTFAQLAPRIADAVGAEFPETKFIREALSTTAMQEPNAQRNFLTKRR